MRRLTAGLTVAAAATLLVACGGNDSKPASSPASSSAAGSSATAASKAPIAQAALGGLLLTPAEIDTLAGVTGTTSKEKIDKLQDDAAKTPPGPPGWKFPDECLYVLGPAETVVYKDSGNTAVAGDDDVTNVNNDSDIELGQALVLFPSSKEATDFYNKSVQGWQSCSDRQIVTPSSNDTPELTWKISPFTNNNGLLSVTATMTAPPINGGPPLNISVQRALTLRNNVIVDVILMRKDPADLGAKAAAQIADKVDKAQ